MSVIRESRRSLACARVAHVATSCRFRTTGPGFVRSPFPRLLAVVARSLLAAPFFLFFRQREARPRALSHTPSKYQTELEKRTSGPQTSAVRMQITSSTAQRVHMVVHHYRHDTSLLPAILVNRARACFRVRSTYTSSSLEAYMYRAGHRFPPKTFDRSAGSLRTPRQTCVTRICTAGFSFDSKYHHAGYSVISSR